ncbi:MAG: class I SAM-dependent methyltransferase [Candidatus Sumerlaeia bacterium]|nr:class I SAM-dependent methyltransferase [Candidatus Sumerlaeia bacterium]
MDRWQRNRRHWAATLDARNLAAERRSDPRAELGLYETLDIRRALRALGPLRGRRVLALGDGLGLAAALLARRGAEVVIVDLAATRLAEGNRNLAVLSPGCRAAAVAGLAEFLPLADASVDALLTKSVLIHTDLPRAAAELNRVLRPGGRGVFIEPTPHNPFVRAYRRLAAPKVWEHITTYFGDGEVGALAAGFPGARVRVRRSHFLAFFALAFAFAVPNAGLLRRSEAALDGLDRALFRLWPGSRRRCWFVMVVVEKSGA